MVVQVGGHNGPYRSHYAHLDRTFVKTGDFVNRGDPIGSVIQHKRIAKYMLEIAGNKSPQNLDRLITKCNLLTATNLL